LLTAVRPRGDEERGGPLPAPHILRGFSRQRLFWLLFWSQKSDNRATSELMNTYEKNSDVNKRLFENLKLSAVMFGFKTRLTL
jgi:hypothetical protein